jgi:hypothetical protein
MSQHEPEATPQQQEAVRRLLAEARHDEPVPAHVGARLDAVLAGLAAEGPRAVDPPPPGSGAPVVDLGARRRRRVVALLGAAAAVVVLGVGVAQVVDPGQDEAASDSGGSAASADDLGEGEDGAAQEESSPAATSGPRPSEVPSVAPGESGTDPAAPEDSSVPVITSLRFSQEAVRIRDEDPGVPTARGLVLGGRDLTTSSMFICDPNTWGEGRLVAVEFQGMPAVLAYRPPAGNTQPVELLQCGSGDLLRSTVVPYP